MMQDQKSTELQHQQQGWDWGTFLHQAAVKPAAMMVIDEFGNFIGSCVLMSNQQYIPALLRAAVCGLSSELGTCV